MDGGEQPAEQPDASQPELTKHELRELKKQEKLEQRQQQSSVAVEQGKKQRTRNYLISASVVVLLVAAFWWWSSNSNITGAVTVDPGDHPALGSGPVQFVVFGDFQCPFTKRFWQNAFPEIQDKYGDKLRIVFWPVPTAKHNYDRASAMAAYCANEQGKFWEYAKVVFDRQGAATDGNLMDYARELKLDADAFWQCYSSDKYEDKVQEDYVQGRKYGVVQTPTVVIGGQLLSGDLPFDDYKTFIEYALQSP